MCIYCCLCLCKQWLCRKWWSNRTSFEIKQMMYVIYRRHTNVNISFISLLQNLIIEIITKAMCFIWISEETILFFLTIVPSSWERWYRRRGGDFSWHPSSILFHLLRHKKKSPQIEKSSFTFSENLCLLILFCFVEYLFI